MRNRDEWHAPTEQQLGLACALGVNIPEGISRYGLSLLIDRHDWRQIRSMIKELDLRPGRHFRRKQDGATYEIRSINLQRRELNVLNQTLNRGTTVGLSRFTEFYEITE